MSSRSPEQVEASRRLLHALLDRRDFINWSAAVVAAASGLPLSACGGGDGTTSNPNPPPPPPPPTYPDAFPVANGTVTLPSGSTLKPADLMVDVGTQVVAISSGGSFTVGVPPSGPSLALLTDGSGTGVLMAMFQAGGTQAINAQTTAVTMLYYATGAYLLPTAALAQVLTLLANDPATAALATTIAQSVAADPHAIINNAAPLGPAVRQALTAMLGSAQSSVASSGKGAGDPASDTVPTLMLITPSAPQNGVGVDQDAAAANLLISNTKRRGCKVYVYEITTQTGNVVTDVNPAVRVAGPIDLASTENLSLFTSLKDFTTFFHGTSPWSPVNLAPLPLSLRPSTADKTIYQVIVLASSWKVLTLDAQEPSFFRDAHFVNEVPDWRSDAKELYYATVFGDILLPTLCFFAGIGAIAASRAVIASVVAQAAAAKSATFTRILTQLEAGSLGELKTGIQSVVNDVFSSDISRQFWKPMVRQIIGQAEQKALDAESDVLASSRWAKGARMFQSVFAPIFAAGIILDGIDFAAVIYDTFNSDIGASWIVDLLRQKLDLKPQDARITPGERVNFTVTPPANLTGTFVYEWTESSLFAVLSAVGEANVGKAITTSKLAVDLQTTGSDSNPISVLVIGYDTSKTPRQEIGRAGTTVNFLYPAEILPSNAALEPGDHRVFSVLVTGQLPPNTVYKWTVSGTAGSIGGGTVTTSVPQIDVSAGSVPGNGLLHVDVVDSAGVRWAKADVGFTVNGPPSITFTIAGAWDPSKQPPNGVYNYPGGNDVRTASPGGGGNDAIFFAYDLAGPDGDIGVLLTMLVPTGSLIHKDQSFTKYQSGTFVAGEFQLTLSNNQQHPDDPNATQFAPVGTGTLKFDDVNQLINGTWVVKYSFAITNAGGGTIVGSGSARFS